MILIGQIGERVDLGKVGAEGILLIITSCMLAVFLLSVAEIADPCCAVFLGHKSVPDTALCRSHGA